VKIKKNEVNELDGLDGGIYLIVNGDNPNWSFSSIQIDYCMNGYDFHSIIVECLNSLVFHFYLDFLIWMEKNDKR
jgi:hypothetical protein